MISSSMERKRTRALTGREAVNRRRKESKRERVRERPRKGHGVPCTFVSAERGEERVGGRRDGNRAGSARAAAGTRASRVHSRSSNIAGGAREISINAALCNVPRDRDHDRYAVLGFYLHVTVPSVHDYENRLPENVTKIGM